MVPVFVDDAGAVTIESRDSCEKLWRGPAARARARTARGPDQAYADFIDGPAEACLPRRPPFVRDQWKTDWERGLYTSPRSGSSALAASTRGNDGDARSRAACRPSLSTLAVSRSYRREPDARRRGPTADRHARGGQPELVAVIRRRFRTCRVEAAAPCAQRASGAALRLAMLGSASQARAAASRGTSPRRPSWQVTRSLCTFAAAATIGAEAGSPRSARREEAVP